MPVSSQLLLSSGIIPSNPPFYILQKAKSKKKKFIDPKNEPTQTFEVIHRSQKDPLSADSDAPQKILQPLESTKVIFFHQCSDQ